MLKCWFTINCSTSSKFPCALVQIFSWTTLQQSLIWTKKQFHFFTLSPSNAFLVGSWQQLPAKQHPETSSHYQQRRNLSLSFPVNDKCQFFLFILLSGSLIYAVCQEICWCESLLVHSAYPESTDFLFCWSKEFVPPYCWDKASTTKFPNALHQGHFQPFSICCLSCLTQ